MAGTIMPAPWFTGLDNNGNPVTGGKLYTYEAGTSVLLATFTDVNLTVPHSNPIILDGGGRVSAYLSAASYKFVLKDANDVTIRTQDNIAANAAFNVDLDIAGVAGENLPGGSVVFLSNGTNGLIGGRWYLAHADVGFASADPEVVGIVQSAVLIGGVGNVRLLGRSTVPGPLVPGQAYYVANTPSGSLSATPGTFLRLVGIADSITTLVSATTLGTTQIITGDVDITQALTVGGTATFGQWVSIGGNLAVNGGLVQFGVDTSLIRTTLDGADTGSVFLCGGGAPLPTRGAFIGVSGNEAAAGDGSMLLSTGEGGSLTLALGSTTPHARIHPDGCLSWGNFQGDTGTADIFIGLATSALTDKWIRVVTTDGRLEMSAGVSTAKPLISFATPGGVAGQIITTALTTAYGTTSDARLKTDLALPMETDVLSRLLVHDFQWKVDGTMGRGLFAQEAVEVLPVAVTVGCEGPVVDEPWMVDYSKVVPDLIVGWQQHDRRIIDLLERVKQLESRDAKPTP